MNITLTYATIWAVVICYFASVWGWLGKPPGHAIPLPVRILWSLAALLLLAHAGFAFAGFYEWSHLTAVQQTALRTKEFTGWERGEGLYLNYLLVGVWLSDAAWMVAWEKGYRSRPRVINLSVHGFVLFMLVNGAVVFATGPIRWVTLLLLGLVCLRLLDSQRRRGNSNST